MAQTRHKPGTQRLTPQVFMPTHEARALKAALALEGLAYNELVLDLTRRWLADRTHEKTPPAREGA